MSQIVRASVRVGIAAAAATGLVAGGMSVAQAAAHRPAAVDNPSLRGTFENHKLTLTGETAFPAGRLTLTVKAVDHESELSVVTLHPGYSFKDLRDDIRAFGESFDRQGNPSKAGLKALNHAINHVTSYGGLDVSKGKTDHAVLLIPEASGTTIAYNDSGNLPKQQTVLSVGSAAGPQTLPAADAKVVATTHKRFQGDDVLPATGVIRFKNTSTESPHFMSMQHVKEGTTRKQVIDGLQSNSFSFARKGTAGTEFLTTDQSMNLQVNLPAGEYALMCFFPDPKTGMPHAFMGMVNIVHLK
jgi:hypothetical protein